MLRVVGVPLGREQSDELCVILLVLLPAHLTIHMNNPARPARVFREHPGALGHLQGDRRGLCGLRQGCGGQEGGEDFRIVQTRDFGRRLLRGCALVDS